MCPSSSYDGFVQNETAVTGFDVELLRWVLTNAKYAHDPASGFSDPFFKVYAWRCSPSLVWNQVDVSSYTDALSSGPYPASSPANVSQPPLPTPPGSSPRGTPANTIPTPADARPGCDISVGKLPVLSALAAEGVQYIPYYSTGSAILTQGSVTNINRWAFVNPFHWTLWVAFLLTCIVVPAIVYFVERLSTVGNIELTSHGLHEWRMAQYHTLLAVFNLEVFSVVAIPSQITIVAFCFLVLIVVQTYNAQLGAVFASGLNTGSVIGSMADLKGQIVGTYDQYLNILQGLYPAVTVVGYSANNSADLYQQAISALDTGNISAFVFDVDSLAYLLSESSTECSQYQLGTATDSWAINLNLGFQFNSQWNKTAVAGLFISLIQAQEHAVDTMFSRHFFGNDITKASSCGGGGGGAGGVTFSQMSGLFIIVGAVTATCLTAGLISALHRILSILRQSEEEELRSQSSQTVGRLDDASSGKCLEHGSSLSWQPVRNVSTSRSTRRVSRAFSKVFVSNYDGRRSLELNAVGRLSGGHDRFKNTSGSSSSYNDATMMTRETLTGHDISDGMSDPQGMLR